MVVVEEEEYQQQQQQQPHQQQQQQQEFPVSHSFPGFLAYMTLTKELPRTGRVFRSSFTGDTSVKIV